MATAESLGLTPGEFDSFMALYGNDVSSVSTNSNRSAGSKLNRAAKVVAKTLTFGLMGDDDAVKAAYSHLEQASDGRHVSGDQVWEKQHQFHMGRRSRKALEDMIQERGLEIDGPVKSKFQYEDGEGFWGEFQQGVNRALDATYLSKLVGNLEIHKPGRERGTPNTHGAGTLKRIAYWLGDKATDYCGRVGLDFQDNAYLSPEGTAAMAGLFVLAPVAATTSVSLASSLYSYAAFSSGMSVTSAIADGLHNSQSEIAQNLGTYVGIAAAGLAALAGGHYVLAALRTAGAAAQMEMAKDGHTSSAALFRLGIIGSGIASMGLTAANALDNTTNTAHYGTQPGDCSVTDTFDPKCGGVLSHLTGLIYDHDAGQCREGSPDSYTSGVCTMDGHYEVGSADAGNAAIAPTHHAYGTQPGDCSVTDTFDPRCGGSASTPGAHSMGPEGVPHSPGHNPNVPETQAHNAEVPNSQGHSNTLPHSNNGSAAASPDASAPGAHTPSMYQRIIGLIDMFHNAFEHSKESQEDLDVYSRHYNDKDIVWHNNGTARSDFNELRLHVGKDGLLSISGFDMHRINDINQHTHNAYDLPHGTQLSRHDLGKDDLFMRIAYDSNHDGRFGPEDMWFTGDINSHGTVDHIYGSDGKPLTQEEMELFTVRGHLRDGVMAQVDYSDNGKMHSFATAFGNHGGHHAHSGTGHHNGQYHSVKPEDHGRYPQPDREPTTNDYARGKPGPDTSQNQTPGTNRDVDVRFNIDSYYTKAGSYDLDDRVGVLDSNRTSVAVEVPQGYNHESSFYNQEGYPVHARETLGNRFRHLVYGDDSHDKSREVKEGGFLDRLNEKYGDRVPRDWRTHEVTNAPEGTRAGGHENVANRPLTDDQRIIMREQQDDALSPNGNLTNHYDPQHADVHTEGAAPNLRTSVTEVYDTNGNYVGSHTQTWDVRANEARVRTEDAVAATAAGALYSGPGAVSNTVNSVVNTMEGINPGGPGVGPSP